MKLMSLVTAILVTACLYLLVLERDRLFAFAQGQDTAPAAGVTDAAAVEPAAVEPAAMGVVVLRSTAQTLQDAVILRGQTQAAREVEVQAETSGLVVSEPLRAGSFVEAGALLCELEPGTRQAQLAEATARLREAEARLSEAQARVPAADATLVQARASIAETEARVAEARALLTEAEINQAAAAQLSEGGFASESRVANAQAALQSARAGLLSAEAAVQGTAATIIGAEAGVEGAVAAVEGARAAIQSAQAAIALVQRDIGRLSITAPFAGLLETDTAELGTLLQTGNACATVIQLDPVKLVGFASESDVARIQTGAQAGGRLTSGVEVLGQVTFVSRSADEQTRTFRVEITVPNSDTTIRDGETATIMIQTAGRSAHLIPQSALTLDNDGRLGIRSVTPDNIVQFLPVNYLRDTVDGVWLTDMPSQVDIIVVGQEFVTDGVTVIPTYREVTP